MIKEVYWKKAINRTNYAINKNSLIPLKTHMEVVNDKFGHLFEVRTLLETAKFPNPIYGPKENAFNPWDTNLEIAEIGQDHALILNKYPVQIGHMLLITKTWAPQNGWLTYKDWEALLTVDQDTTGLWFFNSGPIAGASQPHRHLQLLPRRIDEALCPRDYWFKDLIDFKEERKGLLFNSCKVIAIKSIERMTPEDMYDLYLNLCNQLKIGSPELNNRPLKPYNLLITKDWMSLIRRKKESNKGFSINSLGFAGYLLATESSDINWLYNYGPDRLVEGVVDLV
ncbi:DUF4922 domain-containing protein [Prochlorococcus sp. MIT 1341]|uniref:DUF4922 domain-containing protein n=1 Tax=Prochlorococcus sp. MIT 1341 TaxID=3096221 RepID=UPI002A74F318|nr:DUF4922 domain-containing protein [Prochlorococcus sp. MIT 1341]